MTTSVPLRDDRRVSQNRWVSLKKKIMETREIKFLPIEKFKILKAIRVVGNEWNKFTGYIPYLRTFNPKNYDFEKGDELDEKIISIFKSNFSKVDLWINEQIVFEDQLETMLRTIEGGSKKNMTFQFSPLLPYHEASKFVGKTFNAYPIQFKMRLLTGQENKRINQINDYFICQLNYKKLDEFVETIKSV